MMRRLTTALLVSVVGIGSAQIGSAAGVFSQINRGDDPKHTPVIDAPDTVTAGEPFKVTIMVGKTLHPSLVDHNIHWIALYADEVELARATLTPTLAVPIVTFNVMLQEGGTLRALAAPNHSAPWEASRKIAVKPAATQKP